MASPPNKENYDIISFLDIEGSSHEEGPSKPKQVSSTYTKKLWLATGCMGPCDDVFVVGCPYYVKTIKSAVLSSATRCVSLV